MISPAVVAATEPSGERPAITYRQAGDRCVLVEYGEHELDLRLNFLVVAVFGKLLDEPPPGFVEAAPGLRSMVVTFDADEVSRDRLLESLQLVHERLPAISSLTIPSRIITLPIAFDDSSSRGAVERYVATIRHDAPNALGGNNIDYIVQCNGLSGREELYSAVTDVSWWAAFTGFFPGLPFLFPLDPRREIFAPKYNPTRAWTAEGAVGIGGACVAIYPVESPGSYQLFGRTVPIYDVHGRHARFRHDPFLIRPGDRVRFVRVSETELLNARRQIFDNRYDYRIEESPFVVADHLEELSRLTSGAATAATLWDETEVP